MNSLVENQINKFLSGRGIIERKILSKAFNIKCEKVILDTNQTLIFKYYIKKNQEFNNYISEFAEEIIKLTGTNQRVIYKDLPVDDPKQRCPDITQAQNILGWKPKVSRHEGLKITYEYFKSLSKEELFEKEHMNFDKYIVR